MRSLERKLDRGVGRGLVEHLRSTGAPLLTTFFAPALIADRAARRDGGSAAPIYCVVTDVDISRAWVPADPAATTVRYLVPSRRALRRLRAYGVPRANLEMTGFPLPGELLGGPELAALRANLAARLVRLDPKQAFREQFRDEIDHFLGELPADEERRPPLVVFAVGGAGAQAELARRVIAGLAPRIEEGIARLCLVAGVRRELAAEFARWVARAGLERHLGGAVEILYEETPEAYFRRFNRLLAGADVLWTKPSELSFFAALGLPLVLSWPLGVHERYNRRWALEHGAALKQREPRYVGSWIAERLGDGTLAGMAWSGFLRLPKFGLYQILETLERDGALRRRGGGAG